MRTQRVLRLSSLIIIFTGLLNSGCRQTRPGDLDPVQKAKETHRLQREAADCQRRFRQSDATDLDALECYISAHKQTTAIHPSPMQCPGCFRSYGLGLRLLGMYHWQIRADARRALEEASPRDAPALKAEIEKQTKIVRKHFRESILKLEAYISTRQAIDPQTYDWVSQQYAELGDFRRALQFLDLLEANLSVSGSDRETLRSRRRHYQQQQDKIQNDRVRRSLEREEKRNRRGQ